MNTWSSRLATVAAGCGTGYALIRFRQSPRSLVTNLTAPHEWCAQVGVDRAIGTLAAALLWICALWLALGLIASVLSLLPGRIGAVSTAITAHAVPAILRNLIFATTGASMLFGPVAAIADTPAPTAPIATATGAPSWPLTPPPAQQLGPRWPIGPTARSTSAGSQPAAPNPASSAISIDTNGPAAPRWPVTVTPPRANTNTSAGAGPVTSAAPATKQPQTTRPDPQTPPKGVTHLMVEPGDSLWMIAANRLGPSATEDQIALEWPNWYRDNRAAIGTDPARLMPGTELTVPAGSGA